MRSRKTRGRRCAGPSAHAGPTWSSKHRGRPKRRSSAWKWSGAEERCSSWPITNSRSPWTSAPPSATTSRSTGRAAKAGTTCAAPSHWWRRARFGDGSWSPIDSRSMKSRRASGCSGVERGIPSRSCSSPKFRRRSPVNQAQVDPDVLARLRAEVARYSIKSFERGLVGGAGGNVSVRIPGTGEVLITRTGVILGEVTPEDVVRIDLTGRPLDPHAPKPSKEVPFHTVVYRLRPDVNALIHLHPRYTVVQSLRLADLPLLTVSALW